MTTDQDPAADAFSIVGDQNRAAIIRALVEHRTDHPDDPELSFSALHDRSGIDDKGNFNYHLDRLRGTVVERGEEGYRLTMTGDKVAGALLSGRYADSDAYVPVDGRCPTCQRGVMVRFDGSLATVECAGEADHVLLTTRLPPGAVDAHDNEDLLDVLVRHWGMAVELSTDGACMECYGPIDGRIEPLGEGGDPRHVYRAHCERCGVGIATPVWALTLRQPAVVSLFHDHGLDALGGAPWQYVAEGAVHRTEASTDPFRLAITWSFGADELTVTLDRSGEVVPAH